MVCGSLSSSLLHPLDFELHGEILSLSGKQVGTLNNDRVSFELDFPQYDLKLNYEILRESVSVIKVIDITSIISSGEVQSETTAILQQK